MSNNEMNDTFYSNIDQSFKEALKRFGTERANVELEKTIHSKNITISDWNTLVKIYEQCAADVERLYNLLNTISGYIQAPDIVPTTKSYVDAKLALKVNRDTDPETIYQMRLYGHDEKGTETVFPTSFMADSNSVALRDSFGRVLTQSPAGETDAVNLEYADKHYLSKMPYDSFNKDVTYVRAQNGDILNPTVTASAEPNSVPVRDENGRMQVEDGVSDKDVINYRQFKDVENLAKQKSGGISFDSYEDMVNFFKYEETPSYTAGVSIYIVTIDVPDLWIKSVNENRSEYAYTTDIDITDVLESNGTIDIGHYTLAALETLKLDVTEVANTVLEEAKESGMFDGQSATHEWNGTVLTMTSASGTSSSDLKGDSFKYEDFTQEQLAKLSPVKGIDYYTESDKDEITNKVLRNLNYVTFKGTYCTVPILYQDYSWEIYGDITGSRTIEKISVPINPDIKRTSKFSLDASLIDALGNGFPDVVFTFAKGGVNDLYNGGVRLQGESTWSSKVTTSVTKPINTVGNYAELPLTPTVEALLDREDYVFGDMSSRPLYAYAVKFENVQFSDENADNYFNIEFVQALGYLWYMGNDGNKYKATVYGYIVGETDITCILGDYHYFYEYQGGYYSFGTFVINGKSAYELAIENGTFEGTEEEWLASLDFSNYVQKTQLATEEEAGLVKVYPYTDHEHPTNKGVRMNPEGYLEVSPATKSYIDAGVSSLSPIVPRYVSYAVKKGLTNPTIRETDSSSVTTLPWTDAEKKAARQTLGAEVYRHILVFQSSTAAGLAASPERVCLTIYNTSNESVNAYVNADDILSKFKIRTLLTYEYSSTGGTGINRRVPATLASHSIHTESNIVTINVLLMDGTQKSVNVYLSSAMKTIQEDIYALSDYNWS